MIYYLYAYIQAHYTQLFACVHQNIVDQSGCADSDCDGGEDFAGDFLYALERFGVDNADIFDLGRWDPLQCFLHFGDDLTCIGRAGFD